MVTQAAKKAVRYAAKEFCSNFVATSIGKAITDGAAYIGNKAYNYYSY